MLLKSDFVTNSSSTTFLIADGREEPEDLIIEVPIKVNLRDLVQYIFRTEEDIERFEDFWGSDLETFPHINEVREAVRRGDVVYYIEAGDECAEPGEVVLCHNGLKAAKIPDGMTVIQGEGGY